MGLAPALLASGALTSDWLPTFEAVPRHLFVPDRIWPGKAGGAVQAEQVVSRADDPDAWWEAVNSDIPLTFQWDDGEHTGNAKGTTPSSSSSMPTMVVSMLADLDVDAGMRVLEVGTGTGWNAALLAHRLGDENVVTIEVDADVSAAAATRLERAGLNPRLVVGDGGAGLANLGQFDRLEATCSIARVPAPWLELVRPGGLVVSPLGTEYGGEAVVRLAVREDGTAVGRFTRSSAFMRMRQQRSTRPPLAAYLKGKSWPADGERSFTRLSPADTGDWIDQFAIGLQVRGCFWRAERYRDGSYTLWLYSTDTASWATADWEAERTTYEVVQSGPRRLWDEVETAWRWWNAAGRPDFERFGLTVTPDGHTPWLDDPANTLPQFGK
ncbi:methyltransferase domain-containing protein [Kitasatospora sp. NPDC101155]|uniref:methyltransferase domain-containing protein n=1 Tax=Kitasatospora sp. NPDC101155 TaxID=3364097 RepID=UPI0038139BE7